MTLARSPRAWGLASATSCLKGIQPAKTVIWPVKFVIYEDFPLALTGDLMGMCNGIPYFKPSAIR